MGEVNVTRKPGISHMSVYFEFVLINSLEIKKTAVYEFTLLSV